MALVGAELVLRSGDKKIRELPEEFEAMAPAWNFEYTPEEIKQAMVAVKKIGQNGSELDFVIEGKGEKIYQEWQKYLSDLHRELETMLG
jgi:HD superfamily phosphodiesterase